jgi:hypothetical protein
MVVDNLDNQYNLRNAALAQRQRVEDSTVHCNFEGDPNDMATLFVAVSLRPHLLARCDHT